MWWCISAFLTHRDRKVHYENDNRMSHLQFFIFLTFQTWPWRQQDANLTCLCVSLHFSCNSQRLNATFQFRCQCHEMSCFLVSTKDWLFMIQPRQYRKWEITLTFLGKIIIRRRFCGYFFCHDQLRNYNRRQCIVVVAATWLTQPNLMWSESFKAFEQIIDNADEKVFQVNAKKSVECKRSAPYETMRSRDNKIIPTLRTLNWTWIH